MKREHSLRAEAQPLAGTRLDRGVEALLTLAPKRAWPIGLSVWAVLAICDYATGRAFSFGALYTVVICFAAITIGSRAAFGLGVGMIALGYVLNGPSGLNMPLSDPLDGVAMVWNAAMRLIALAVILALISVLRRAYAAARLQADRDPLTGALNRRGLEFAFLSSAIKAKRSGQKLLIAYIDIDNFKMLNDGAGHHMGDAILKQFAAGASTAVRAGDHVARIGGDEFLLIIILDDVAEGRAAAKRIHADLKFILADSAGILSCSMGAVIHDPRDHFELETLLKAADDLLLAAKRSGRGSLRFGRAVNERRRTVSAPLRAI